MERGPSGTIARLCSSPEEVAVLRRELLCRAAVAYERAREWGEAASCWQETGQPERAAEAFARAGEPMTAARLLMRSGNHAAALPHFETVADDFLWSGFDRVGALLGIAACHLTISGMTSKAFLTVGQPAAQEARRILTDARHRTDAAAAQAWALLGDYGRVANRYDLVQQGYETALAHGRLALPAAECRSIREAYLAAAREAGDTLLASHIAAEAA
ncbi:hypothetical protein M2352_003360 [Azospirillum fermentarium]|uniref:hypothetical protein n=1 Tax=Azospirillum fermentarium TaxID=1233114 RepID=UPI00222605ED|nr:hypothetical protein [Azospirillum fermentarium]MCW2247726.1 hypothetical protein [Azospirillum fermentarium]